MAFSQMHLIPTFFLFSIYVSLGHALLPSYPLALRSPYLSAWLPGDQIHNVARAQPEFWVGPTQPLTWSIMARVNGASYALFGVSKKDSNVQEAKQLSNISYTSTHTIMKMEAEDAIIDLDFFSPVSPKNYIRQSLPYSYLTVSVSASASAKTHPKVQIFTSLDSSWLGATRNVSFDLKTTQYTTMLTMKNPNAVDYVEVDTMATWGEIVLATDARNDTSVTHGYGDTRALIGKFNGNGSITGNSSKKGNAVGISQDLGTVHGVKSVNFAVGHYRDHSVNYLGQPYTGYYRSKYPDAISSTDYFLRDYEDAYAESMTIDKTVQEKSVAASSENYAALTSATLRQVFGAMEITLPEKDLHTAQDPYVFLKEISTDGNVNTVDVIYPMWPLLTVIAPNWIKYLLEPLLHYMDEPKAWDRPYTVHDLGKHYPMAVGHKNGDAEDIFTEVTASLMIMILSYQQLSGDTAWAKSHAEKLRSFADWLAKTAINSPYQRDTVDLIPATADQTGLSIVSAIGLNAYAALSGNTTYHDQAQTIAEELYKDGHGLNSAKTHFTYNIGKSESWGTLFNFWPDTYLHLNTFPAEAHDMQCDWYTGQMAGKLGKPYASGLSNRAQTLWDMWIVPECEKLTQQLVDDEFGFLNNGKNTVPFADSYFITGEKADIGTWTGYGRARPTMGSVWALLAQKGVKIAD